MPIKTFIKVFVDVFLLICVGLPILLFYLLGVPFQRGFFCNDETIRYPFKDSTVTSGALYAFGTIIPIASIILIEYFHIRSNVISTVRKEKFWMWCWALYRYVGIFLFGCAISHLTVDICKYSIGRLRPHFIDVCKPDWSKLDCETEENYVIQDVCTPETPEDHHLLREARLSFISGHSSFAAYTMCFLIFYLQFRFCAKSFHLLRPVFQYLCFGVAVFTALSRVSDYKHHWSDVVMGFINGILFAVFCVFWVAKVHRNKCDIKGSDELGMCTLNPHRVTQQP